MSIGKTNLPNCKNKNKPNMNEEKHLSYYHLRLTSSAHFIFYLHKTTLKQENVRVNNKWVTEKEK